MKRHGQAETHTDNYLTLYLYNNRHLADSVRVEHPLYKHYEYLDAENKLAAKDMVLDKADFIVRFQTAEPTNRIAVMETLKNAGTRQLSTIKL